jgi:hypothetical protein
MAVFAPFLDVAFDLLSDTPGASNQAGFAEVMGALRDSRAVCNYSLTSATWCHLTIMLRRTI